MAEVEEASDAIEFEEVQISEADLIKKFREAIAIDNIVLDEYFGSEPMLMRWLRARKMDVNEALKMLKESLEWKSETGINVILDWKPPSEFIDDFPFYICGLDNEGDPFGVVTWRKWNIDALLSAIYKDGGKTHLRYFYQCMEIIHRLHKEQTQFPEKIVSRGIVVVDVEGLAVSQFASKEAISVILEGTRRFEANYPGLLKKVVVVNAPTIFSMLWQIISPLLSEETKSIVEVHGYYSYNDDWKASLRQILPIDQLPSHYGGANTNCKPYKFQHGFKKFQDPHVSLDRFDMKTVNVAAGEQLKICINVDRPQSILRWEFKSEYYDIGFSVIFEQQQKEAVDYSRADSHVVLQKGALQCMSPGNYYLVFDNSFSRFRGKRVQYRVHLFEPVKTEPERNRDSETSASLDVNFTVKTECVEGLEQDALDETSTEA